MMLTTTQIKSLKKLFSGKVRDVYEIDASRLLLVATDRLSAFDVVFQEGIPEKGRMLTELSNFWFAHLSKAIPELRHHLLPIAAESVVAANERDQVAGRAVVVRRTRPLPIEAVVRGYLAGSGWKAYQETGALCGMPLPKGLAQSAKFPTPLFTPASKAAVGEHDENITFADMITRVGEPLAQQVKTLSLKLYQTAAQHALARGLMIADTKFEFGMAEDENGQDTLMLIDEALTPDSSRYWAIEDYREGISPPSFDKQIIRDYLLTLDWNQQPPAPPLPPELVAFTARKYQDALDRLQA